jgi:hypothetical protein
MRHGSNRFRTDMPRFIDFIPPARSQIWPRPRLDQINEPTPSSRPARRCNVIASDTVGLACGSIFGDGSDYSGDASQCRPLWKFWVTTNLPPVRPDDIAAIDATPHPRTVQVLETDDGSYVEANARPTAPTTSPSDGQRDLQANAPLEADLLKASFRVPRRRCRLARWVFAGHGLMAKDAPPAAAALVI